MLLRYFNEPDPQPCGQCDICRKAVKPAQAPAAYAEPATAPFTAQDVDELRWAIDQGLVPPTNG
jgi:hypothetical protein